MTSSDKISRERETERGREILYLLIFLSFFAIKIDKLKANTVFYIIHYKGA